MKSTGIVRQIDHLGRIVIPKEIRRSLQFNENEPLEVYVDGEYIIFQRYSPGCLLCGEIENIKQIKDKKICQNCADELREYSREDKEE